jgi:hypothetical protein
MYEPDFTKGHGLVCNLQTASGHICHGNANVINAAPAGAFKPALA